MKAQLGRYTFRFTTTPALEELIVITTAHGRSDLLPREEIARLATNVTATWNGGGTTMVSGSCRVYPKVFAVAVSHGLLLPDQTRDTREPTDRPPHGRIWVRDVVTALESGNTDTGPRWLAAKALRELDGWWSHTLEVPLHL